jgi:hypothetical protein
MCHLMRAGCLKAEVGDDLLENRVWQRCDVWRESSCGDRDEAGERLAFASADQTDDYLDSIITIIISITIITSITVPFFIVGSRGRRRGRRGRGGGGLLVVPERGVVYGACCGHHHRVVFRRLQPAGKRGVPVHGHRHRSGAGQPDGRRPVVDHGARHRHRTLGWHDLHDRSRRKRPRQEWRHGPQRHCDLGHVLRSGVRFGQRASRLDGDVHSPSNPFLISRSRSARCTHRRATGKTRHTD